MAKPRSSPTRPSFAARFAAPILVLAAPRRAGRLVAHSRLVWAALTHVLALLIAGAVLVHATEIILLLDSAGSPRPSALAYLSALIRGSMTGATMVLKATTPGVVLAATIVVGEVFYWSAATIVFAYWTGLNARPTRLYGRGAVLAGYASMWLIPATASWAAVAYLFAYWGLVVGTGAGRGDLLLGGIGLCAGVLPALMLAAALRLGRGAGEVLVGDDPPADKQCEQCGYNLHATPFDGTCPECGLAARCSLSPIHRSCGWETGTAGYLRTMAAVVFKPGATFSRLRTNGSFGRARSFLGWSTALSAGLLGLLLVAATLRPSPLPMVHFLLTPLLYTGAWIAGIPAASMFAAGTISGFARRQGDRLTPRGAAKIGCYLSAMAVPFAALTGLLAVGILEGQRRRLLPLKFDMAHHLLVTLFVVGLFLWYWFTASRAYASSRHANT